jgi:hypothetical protein
MLGCGIPAIAYFIAWLIMPPRPEGYVSYIDVKPTGKQKGKGENTTQEKPVDAGRPTWEKPVDAGRPIRETPANAGRPVWEKPVDAGGPPGEGCTENDYFRAAYAAKNSFQSPNTSQQSNTSQKSSTASADSHNPGAAYTASNSQTFDAVDPHASGPGSSSTGRASHHRTVRGAVVFGILLVCFGVIALLGTLVDISWWCLWPLVLIVAGIVALFVPGKQGWSLERAGNAIVFVSLGIVLQAWVLGIVPGSTFLRILAYLWPVLLVIIGLSILGSALQKSVFNLLGSLVFSATLILGTWCCGQITGPVFLQFPAERPIVLNLPHSPDSILGQDAPSIFWVWR